MLREHPLWGRTTAVFTLQWHLTNACEGRCAHCYDRRELCDLPTADCLRILDDFQAFCRQRDIRGQICLSGGNPLLHAGFWEIYTAIARAGLPVSILGNPLDTPALARLLAIQRPAYYQVSLEGLRETNDALRGPGHFARTRDFLQAAKAAHLTTQVMLTLQRANLDDVIPLGLQLAPLIRKFTFNRLAQVGEARGLAIPSHAEYAHFLRDYLETAAAHPVFGCKDNLFNILRHAQRAPLFAGCTGQGCGAAFNFVAVLPDGEVHACRKFPSPLGRVPEQSLTDLYDSPCARNYRQGPRACRRCPLHRACRGCMAVIHGHGGNPLQDRDPQCFL